MADILYYVFFIMICNLLHYQPLHEMECSNWHTCFSKCCIWQQEWRQWSECYMIFTKYMYTAKWMLLDIYQIYNTDSSCGNYCHSFLINLCRSGVDYLHAQILALIRGQLINPAPIETSIDLWWGLLNQFLPFRYFPKFSALSKHILIIEYHTHIWQVSPQLSCGGTCQI